MAARQYGDDDSDRASRPEGLIEWSAEVESSERLDEGAPRQPIVGPVCRPPKRLRN